MSKKLKKARRIKKANHGARPFRRAVKVKPKGTGKKD